MKELLLLLLVTEAYCRSRGSRCQSGCECRGDLKFAVCSRGPGRVPPDTELLDLSHNHISVIPERSFGRTRRLRFLLLQNNNVSVVEDGGFSQMEFLQKLDLTEGFSLGLAFLRELQLAHNLLARLDTRSFLHLDDLQRLNLSSNAIHSIQVRSFSSMSSVLAAMLMGERRRKKEKKRKHWTQQGAQSDESDS